MIPAESTEYVPTPVILTLVWLQSGAVSAGVVVGSQSFTLSISKVVFGAAWSPSTSEMVWLAPIKPELVSLSAVGAAGSETVGV